MLKKWFQRRSDKAGLPPGSLVYFGDKKPEKPLITIFDYNEAESSETEVETAEETFPYRDKGNVSWINVSRLTDAATVEKIGSHYNIHPLILEDILTQGQRPKMENMEEYLFVILNMLTFDSDNGNIKAEQVSLVLGRCFLISFQEIAGDVFDPLRDRLRTARGRIRKMGPDYLAYSLIDAIVDNYFIIMEKLGEKIDDLETELLENPRPETLHRIHLLKREILFLRKSVWPLREVVNGLERSESPLIQETTVMYLRDLYDHTIQVIDTVETFRDMLAGILDTYLSSVSNRMNEVMKVLTVISTTFIPLTFIAGIYGMNFDAMPELHYRWGYHVTWSVMICIALGMVYYFRRRKWF